MIESNISLYDQFTHMDSLRAAWHHILHKGGGAAGGDGVDKAKFAKNSEKKLEILAAQLSVQAYQPGPVRIVEIPKKRGGCRVLSIPCVIDRVVQRAVAAGLSTLLEPEFENSSYAYRPRRSVIMASERLTTYYARGFTHVYESDVDDYFTNIPHEGVLAQLAKFAPDAKLHDIVTSWLAMDGDTRKGLPQGAPISPVLANLYLDPLDEAMDRPGWGWVRYADDFVCLAGSEADARAARRKTIEVLDTLGLAEKPSKTRITTFDGGMRFLGRLFIKSMMMTDRDGLTPEEEHDLILDNRLRPDVETGQVGDGAAIGQRSMGGLKRAPAEMLVHHSSKPQDLVNEHPIGVGMGIEQDDALSDHEDTDFLSVGAEQEPASGPIAPVTRTLYVTKPNHVLTLRGKSLAVEDGDANLIWIKSVSDVDRIDIGSHAHAESPAIRRAISAGIAVFFVDGHGQSQGVCVPSVSRRGRLHLNQAQISLDPIKRLELARILVAGKIRNQRRLLKKWILLNKARDKQATQDINAKLAFAAKSLNISKRQALLAVSVQNALQVEGQSTKIYWQSFRDQLRKSEFGARARRPAPDPVNVVLNWTSWLLARDLRVQIERAGLHAGFGVLHGTRDGYSSCVYDFIEEFRAPIAEKLTMSLFNKGPLREDDFYRHKTYSDTCMILPDGTKKIIRAYEAFVSRSNLDRQFTRGKTHWRGLIRDQIHAYIRHVNGDEIYAPYVMGY